MKNRNLAGDERADIYIRQELQQAGIPIKRVTQGRTEVPYSLIGKLPCKNGGEFTFTRAWYYWVVEGRVPLNVAQQLYQTDIGQRDIRVQGHCGCPPPEEWAMPDFTLMSTEQLMQVSGLTLGEMAAKCNSGEINLPRFVDIYHIDSQEGLDLFIKTLRRNSLV